MISEQESTHSDDHREQAKVPMFTALRRLQNPRNWSMSVLTVIALCAAGLWGFLELTDEVLDGETQSFDERILMSMRAANDPTDPIGDRWLEEMGRDLTALGGMTVLSLITLSAITYLLLTQRSHTALLVAVAIGSGMLASVLLKQGFDRSRPDLVTHYSHVYTSSFPSGHSMMAALCYLTLASLLASVEKAWRVKIFLLSTAVFLTVAVGISRVYMGVHWPTDVVAGWLAGAVWAIACSLIARYLQMRGRIEPESE